jgi:cytidyltransferase-like protein
MKPFKQAIVGGTFDHLHAGHKKFLDAAFLHAEHVHINISLPELTKHKPFFQSIQPYDVREKNIIEYLAKNHVTNRATIHQLHDIYGMAATDTHCEAIFVTESTVNNAELINIQRHKNNLPPLEIVMVSYLTGTDKQVISSQRIRAGETDRDGNSYDAFFLGKNEYVLPQALRAKLQQPIGKIFPDMQSLHQSVNKTTTIIAVGDIVSLSLLEEGYTSAICIIDYQTRRHPLDKETLPQPFRSPTLTIANPHGTINKEFAKLYRGALKKQRESQKMQVIAVDGEEDLLALPALLFSPINSVVIYGQYNAGVVVVTVTEEIKDYARKLLKEF